MAAAVHKAFVISPIGEPGSPERQHADWVLEHVIRPACARVGSEMLSLKADRSEHVKHPGDIMDQVLHSIMHDRIVFAVLAFNRPNVYYELALAQAAGRHVIVLRDRGEKSQFDIQGLRFIPYEYPMAGAVLESTIAEVAEFIRVVLEKEAFSPTAFKTLNALGRFYREYDFKKAFREIDIPTYFRVFYDATRFIGLQGISLMHFARRDFHWSTRREDEPKNPALPDTMTFPDLVRAKVMFDAVDVRVVMMHEANPALPQLIKFVDRDRFSDTLADMRDEIKRSFEAWSRLQRELDGRASQRQDGRKGRLEVVRLVHGVVNYRLTVTDQQIIVSPYFNIYTFNSQGPALIVQSDTPFYDSIYREYIDRIVSNEMAAAALGEHGSLEIGSTSETR